VALSGAWDAAAPGTVSGTARRVVLLPMAAHLQHLLAVRVTSLLTKRLPPVVAHLRHLFAHGHRLLLIPATPWLFQVNLRLFRGTLWLICCRCCSLSLQPSWKR
jgi:hypothetical protein